MAKPVTADPAQCADLDDHDTPETQNSNNIPPEILLSSREYVTEWPSNRQHSEQEPLISPPWTGNASNRFATIETLSKFIPEVNPEHPRAKTLRVKKAKRETMLRMQSTLAIVIAVFNIATTIWFLASSPPDFRGVGMLYFGDCSKIKTINSGIHLGLNILSSLFLGAGNYCMQILVAPTRPEIDEAHRKNRSLDIGLPSINNIWHIQRKRALVWVLIAIFAIILHLFWNSAVFSSIPIAFYPTAFVTSDFVSTTDNWANSSRIKDEDLAPNAYQNVSSIYALKPLAQAGNFTRLNKKACMESYIDPLKSTRSLVVIGRNLTSSQNNGSSLIDGWLASRNIRAWSQVHQWICSAYEPATAGPWCTKEFANSFVDEWALKISDAPVTMVDYCLVGDAGDNTQRCGLHYSTYTLSVVCICTLFEALLIFWIWLDYSKSMVRETRTTKQNSPRNTIVTMGDAIQDFLKKRDVYTYREKDGPRESSCPPTVAINKVLWVPESSISWYKVVGVRYWIYSSVVFVVALAVPLVLLGVTIKNLEFHHLDISQAIWQQRFQSNGALLMVDDFSRTGNMGIDLFSKILFANGWQVLVSIIYLFYNTIVTKQLVADEWVRFLRPEGKKPLRISSPIGMQRSSYMLSLPMSYSIPLMVLFMLLHWLVSQSVFLVQTISFGPGPEGSRLPNYDISAVGYTPFGIMLSIILGAFLVLGLILNSLVRKFRNVPRTFVVMGTSSFAISVMCHPPKADKDAPVFPIRIGIVENVDSDRSSSRFTFSTCVDLKEPQEGMEILQAVSIGRKTSFTHRGLITFGAVMTNWWKAIVRETQRTIRDIV